MPPTATTTETPERPALDARAARALACLIGGSAVLVVLALFIVDPIMGLVTAGVALALLLASATQYPASRTFLIYCNGMAGGLLLLQGVGLCSARCGAFVDYAQIGPIATVWAGIIYHGGMLLLGITAQRTGRHWWTYLVLAFIGQGASLFFASILLTHGGWCSSCVAAHVCMVAQMVQTIRLVRRRPERVAIAVMGPVLAALAINAWFHHHVPGAPPSQEEVLVHWLEERSSSGRVALGRVRTERDPHPELDGEADMEAPASQEGAATGEQSTPDTSTPMASLNHDAMTRTHLATWGSLDAPLQVKAALSATCPQCRLRWPDFRNLRPLIDAGILRVDFLWVYRLAPEHDLAAKAAAYYQYMLGAFGPEKMLAGGDYLFSAEGQEQLGRINTMRDEIGNLRAQARQIEEALRRASGGTEVQRLTQQHEAAKATLRRAEDQVLSDAFMAFFETLPDGITMAQALDVYEGSQDDIHAQIQSNFTFIATDGRQGTPRFYLIDQADIDGRPWQELDELDPGVLLYAILRKRQIDLSNLGLDGRGLDLHRYTAEDLRTVATHLKGTNP